MDQKKSHIGNDKKGDIIVQTALPTSSYLSNPLYPPSHLLMQFLPSSGYLYSLYKISLSGLLLLYSYFPIVFLGHY